MKKMVIGVFFSLTLALAFGQPFVFDAVGNLIQPLKGKGKLIDVCGLID